MKKMIMKLLINKISSRREKMKRVRVGVRVGVIVRVGVRVENLNRMSIKRINKMIRRENRIKINFIKLEIRFLIIQKLILMV
jgi:hypothetical protein